MQCAIDDAQMRMFQNFVLVHFSSERYEITGLKTLIVQSGANYIVYKYTC